MVYEGNRDLVSDNGNREVAKVVMTNFNQPQGNPEMGQFSSNSSTKTTFFSTELSFFWKFCLDLEMYVRI